MTEPRLWPDGTPFPDEPAVDRDEADRRYQLTLDWDPFPDIPEALLNSADVYDYVRVTGMIWPFDRECMKAASYEIAIGDRCIFWDQERNLCDVKLKDRQTFILRKNSIVFVSTKEEFRLPHYIALRFNLRITNVHRSILLGTGPLVDPGFAGQLLIPLHNLTTNDYLFQKGERFAWFEFTKVSPHGRWVQNYERERSRMGLQGKYKEFPAHKKWLTPEQYFDKALLNVSPKAIASSIPESIASAERIARKARQVANNIRAWVLGLGIAGVIAVLIGLITVVQSSWQLVSGIQGSVGELDAKVAEVRTRLTK